MILQIIAFDGPVAETLDARAASIVDALREFAMEAPPAVVRRLMPGRTLREVIGACTPHADETTRDLVHLQASRLVSHRLSKGVALAPCARRHLEHLQVNGAQIVLRADSTRQDAEPLLRMAGLESVVRFMQCSDDVRDRHDSCALERSYAAIMGRVGRLRQPADCSAVECDERSADIARRFVAQATSFAGWPRV